MLSHSLNPLTLDIFDIPLNGKCLNLILHVNGHRLKRIEDQRDFRRYKYISFTFQPTFPTAPTPPRKATMLNSKLIKGVDALPFVGEQGESFLVGERSDGGPRY